MSKTSDIGVNTEPLNVEIYITSAGRISWRYGTIDHVVPEPVKMTDEKHLINRHFNTIFTINCEHISDFDTIPLQLVIDTTHIQLPKVSYDSFDYIIFSQANGLTSKHKAWSLYSNDPNNSYIVNYNEELAYINCMLKAVNDALSKTFDHCCIIFDNSIPSPYTIQQIIKDDNEDYTFTVVGNQNEHCSKEFKSISSIIISLSIYELFIDHLLTCMHNVHTWRISILSFIEMNYFNTRIVYH